MNWLEKLFCSRVRARILGELFGMRAEPLHLREIQRRVGLSVATVRQDLDKLVKLGLVTRRKDGNRVYFAANEKHPAWPELKRLVLKTAGLAEVLRAPLQAANIRCAFVFGSVAAGAAGAESDVDLMVIGLVGLRKLSGLLSGLGGKLGREINAHVMTPEEWARRLARKDHFATSVNRNEKVYVIGTANELAAMGG